MFHSFQKYEFYSVIEESIMYQKEGSDQIIICANKPYLKLVFIFLSVIGLIVMIGLAQQLLLKFNWFLLGLGLAIFLMVMGVGAGYLYNALKKNDLWIIDLKEQKIFKSQNNFYPISKLRRLTIQFNVTNSYQGDSEEEVYQLCLQTVDNKIRLFTSSSSANLIKSGRYLAGKLKIEFVEERD